MSYTIPQVSEPFLSGIDLSRGVAVATDFVALTQKADSGRAANDPSRVAALLRFNGPDSTGSPQADGQKGRAIYWDAKLAVDADGIWGTRLDPEDGQDQTSWRFGDNSSLDSRKHPFLVLPGGSFRAETGLALGDVAVVIYRNQLTGAMFGDIGPTDKLGEGSICLHEGLAPAAPDCCHRDSEGQCLRIIDTSIEHGVIVVGFPGSALEGLTPENLEEQVKAHAYDLFAAMKGRVTL